ncbi:MAG: hypothetical protein WB460_07855 [Candidatus Acidiferrales bacterium]
MKNAFEVSGSSPTLAESVLQHATALATRDVNACPSRKKYFETEEDAVAFESINREKYNLHRQYAYKCDSCDGHHLSALPPGTVTMSRINYTELGNSAVRDSRGGRGKRLSDETKQEIKRLHGEDVSATNIAKKLGVSVPSVYNHVRESRPKPPSLPSLDDIAQRKRDLEAELQKLKDKERRLLEAKQFKLTWFDTGFLRVEKEGNAMTLSIADWKELTERLLEELFK